MKKLFLITSVFTIYSCGGKPDQIRSDQTKNVNFKVDFLFEHDGCKVYRFTDGRDVYFTNCNGRVDWQTSSRNGKHTTYQNHQVLTNSDTTK